MRTPRVLHGLGPLVLVAGLVTGLGTAVCGCEPPAPALSPPPPVPSVAVGPVAPAATAFDLSPAAEPADILGVLRWRSPGGMFSTLTGCAGVPQAIADTLLKMGLDELAHEVLRGKADAKQMAGLVALEAPVDLVVALDPNSKFPRPIAAYAIGLTSLDAAKGAVEASGPLTEAGPGMWHVGPKEGSRPTCVIAASAGTTPARLVCAEHERDLEVLGPYLARTLPTLAPLPTDLHAEVRFAAIDARLGSLLRPQLRAIPTYAQAELTIDEPTFDRAVVEAATAVGAEIGALAGDLDTLSIDVSSETHMCLTGSTTLKLRGKSSWTAGMIEERAQQTGPAPALFWHAPKDSVSAQYSRGIDTARYDGILRTLRALADGALTKIKVPEADRKALVELIALPFAKGTDMVVASGHYDGLAPTLGAEPTPQQVVDVTARNAGYYLVGVDEGPAALEKEIKGFVAAYGRKGVADVLKKRLERDARWVPSVKLVAAPAPLGKGALDVEIKVDASTKDAAHGKAEPGKKAERISVTLHVLLMPDGKNTWIAVGTRRDDLVKRLLGARSDAPASGTLAARSGLEPLKSAHNVGGGFATLAALTGSLDTALATPAVGASGADLRRTLAALPHHGETPIFLTTTATGGDAPRAEFSVSVSKDTVEDFGAIATTLVRLVQSFGHVPQPVPVP